MSNAYLDVAAALRRLNLTLQEHGMKPLNAIVLARDKDRDQLIYGMSELIRTAQPKKISDTVEMVINGIRITTPAREEARYAHQDQD